MEVDQIRITRSHDIHETELMENFERVTSNEIA